MQIDFEVPVTKVLDALDRDYGLPEGLHLTSLKASVGYRATTITNVYGDDGATVVIRIITGVAKETT